MQAGLYDLFIRYGVLIMIKITVINEAETRLLKAKKGYSLKVFSNKINISHAYMSQILNGSRNPSPTTANKIAAGLDKKIEEIFFIQIGNNATNEQYTHEVYDG